MIISFKHIPQMLSQSWIRGVLRPRWHVPLTVPEQFLWCSSIALSRWRTHGHQVVFGGRWLKWRRNFMFVSCNFHMTARMIVFTAGVCTVMKVTNDFRCQRSWCYSFWNSLMQMTEVSDQEKAWYDSFWKESEHPESKNALVFFIYILLCDHMCP